MLIRALDYLDTYGIYRPESEITCAISESGLLPNLKFDLQKVIFDRAAGRLSTQAVSALERWHVTAVDNSHFSLSFSLTPGYYVFLAQSGESKCGMSIVIHDRYQAAEIAIIRPVFTQWSYHWEGFYFNESKPLADRLLQILGRLGSVGRGTEGVLRQLARGVGLPGVSFPYKPFPAHKSVSLSAFYRRNNRWDRTIWDQQLGSLEGLWCDELLSGMPIFALLDKNNIPYHVFTDVDLHNQNQDLRKYPLLIFSGQEGMTSAYYEMLRYLQSAEKTSYLLWGVQGFGFRQLNYDTSTGELQYVCTRGHLGMWGDRLEDRQPDWEDEGRIFGFHFPEPQSANWRYERPYSQVLISQPGHPIVRGSINSGKTFNYEVQDLNGKHHAGLTWAGGEVQRRVDPRARVIAHLEDDPELIGIGEYRNTVCFSPTYLPAFFAYQAHNHPEVEAWFLAALDYLTGQNKRCGSA